MAKSGTFLNGYSLLEQTNFRFGPKTQARAMEETLYREISDQKLSYKLRHAWARTKNRIRYGAKNPNSDFKPEMLL